MEVLLEIQPFGQVKKKKKISKLTHYFLEMHDLIPNFHIFSRKISALDIGQGKLGDCYLLSAYASLANRLNGSVLRNMFVEIVIHFFFD